MPFKMGDRVLVVRLNRPGRIVEVLRSGDYRVTVGSFSIQCKLEDLLLDPPQKGENLAKKTGEKTVSIQTSVPTSHTLRRLDLHGLRVADALRQVEEAVNRAILNGQERIEILHGIGTGKIREALYHYLAELVVVKSFKIDPTNPGVTIVYF